VTPPTQSQPVRDAEPLDEVRLAERPERRRRAIAGPTGLALIFAGGALLVRVTVLSVQKSGAPTHPWLFSAAACVLAGVALVLLALPKIVPAEREDTTPAPATQG
jgi:protein-S-isoprenylcysteine O-methyltransferase Ste14